MTSPASANAFIAASTCCAVHQISPLSETVAASATGFGKRLRSSALAINGSSGSPRRTGGTEHDRHDVTFVDAFGFPDRVLEWNEITAILGKQCGAELRVPDDDVHRNLAPIDQ